MKEYEGYTKLENWRMFMEEITILDLSIQLMFNTKAV